MRQRLSQTLAAIVSGNAEPDLADVTRPRHIVHVKIAVASHLAVIQRNDADRASGFYTMHPGVNGAVFVHIQQQVIIVLVRYRTDELLEEFLVLDFHQPEGKRASTKL